MGAVRLHVSNQKVLVWDVTDIQTLRVEHHICGILSGTLPQVSQQNTFLGLPLVLLPEEVVLLVKNNLAVLVDDTVAHVRPTPAQATAYHLSRTTAIETQQRATLALDAAKRVEMGEKFKAEIGKRGAERAAAKKQQAETFDVLVPETLGEGEETTGPPAAAAGGKKGKDVDLASVAYTIVIQPTSDDLPWFDANAATYADLDAAREAGVWNYPSTPLQKARCKVFEDLWRRGNYMGGGLRFGGDFLIYPGDPLRYHSHFTLTVLASPTSSIMPLDLVAYGRLATGVKKAHLLGSWNEAEAKADYFSLEWAAFG